MERQRTEPLSLCHAALIAGIHEAALIEARNDGPWTADAMIQLLQSPGTFGLVSIVGEAQPAGFVMARAIADEAEILALAVVPNFRRLGLGRALMQEAAIAARTRGAERLLLEAADDNLPARALYDALGFQPVGRRRAYYARPGRASVDGLVLALQLG